MAGFTLIELMITLVIAGILLALAVPSMHDFLRSNRLTTAANAMLADLQLARSEAIKRGAHTVMCASTDATTCSGGMAWHQGWLVFADLDDDGEWTAGMDALVQVQESLPEELFTSAGDPRIVFTRHGLLKKVPGTNDYFGEGLFRICNLELNQVRTISVHLTGRSSITEATTCF